MNVSNPESFFNLDLFGQLIQKIICTEAISAIYWLAVRVELQRQTEKES